MVLHLALGSAVTKSAAVAVRFNCPVCEARGVAGEAHDRTEQFKLLHVLPIGTVHSTWVRCPACGSSSRAEVRAAELARYAPGELNRFIHRRLPPVLIVFLVAATLTVILPPIGLAFAITALAMAWKFGGGVRRFALILVGIGALLGLAVGIALLLPDTPPAKPTFAPLRRAPAPSDAKP